MSRGLKALLFAALLCSIGIVPAYTADAPQESQQDRDIRMG
jgi:hypothetical protein